jgi:hypothetical protein
MEMGVYPLPGKSEKAKLARKGATLRKGTPHPQT